MFGNTFVLFNEIIIFANKLTYFDVDENLNCLQITYFSEFVPNHLVEIDLFSDT